MIIAVVLFVSPLGVLGSIAGRSVFNDPAACQAFLVQSTAHMDTQRLVLEARYGVPVAYLAFCHDAGQDV